MIKDVIVNLTVGASRDVAADYAISVATAFGAHLCGIGFAYEAVVPGTVFGGVGAELIQAQRGRASRPRGRSSTISRRRSATRRVGGTHLLEASRWPPPTPSAGWRERFDLSVVAQAEPDKPPSRELIIEAVLFESGRPVLIVPYIQQEGLKLDRVMVCWDGSRTAARATGDAMPFLARAKAVEIVGWAGDAGKSDEIPARTSRTISPGTASRSS